MLNKSSTIKYYGNNAYSKEKIEYFRQFNIDFEICIPKYKPEIEQIVKVWVNPVIIDKQVISTPIGVSLESQSATGYKLMVIGDLECKVEYVSSQQNQSLYVEYAKIPFCGYVVLPQTLSTCAIVTPIVIVEDIYSELIECHCIYSNVTLMLVADFC